MCFEVITAFWLSLSGICNPTNKWGKSLLYYVSTGQDPTAKLGSSSYRYAACSIYLFNGTNNFLLGGNAVIGVDTGNMQLQTRPTLVSSLRCGWGQSL